MPEVHDCPVCAQPTQFWAAADVLNDVRATYYRCRSCGLINAYPVTWLDRAYSSAIAGLDMGLLDRCLVLSDLTAAFLRRANLPEGPFLDWAGGYGVLTRLMRDRGFEFHDFDPLAPNLFAGDRRYADLGSRRFSAVTAFEVLEHLQDPARELADIASRTDVLLLTTQVLPNPAPLPTDWPYFALESGQHITFYTRKSIARLAIRLGFDASVSGPLVHLMYRGKVPWTARKIVQFHQVGFALGHLESIHDRKHSLVLADVERYRKTLHGPPSSQ